MLRGFQERLADIVHGVDDRLDRDHSVGSACLEPISMDADDTYWDPFNQRFAFRPGTRSWPAIDEPRPWVAVDLGPIFAGSHSRAWTSRGMDDRACRARSAGNQRT